jgi:hypothetical protein
MESSDGVTAMFSKRKTTIDLRHLSEATRNLENKEGAFSEWLKYVPAVVWCKDYSEGGKMVFISDEYARLWPKQAKNYVGRFDADVWPAHVAEMFRHNDMNVLKQERVIESIEDTPGSIDPAWNKIRVVKFPIWCGDVEGEPTMVGGIGLRIFDPVPVVVDGHVIEDRRRK